jgi:hypothetical protein
MSVFVPKTKKIDNTTIFWRNENWYTNDCSFHSFTRSVPTHWDFHKKLYNREGYRIVVPEELC